MKNWTTILAFIGVVLFSACANIVAPTGGPRDTLAPKMLNQSAVDSALNFAGGNIVLQFDEYIKLSDLQNNFEISPLTQQNPRIRVKKKNLIIELPDSILEKNTTYHLKFGNAIKDLREGNAYNDLKITFSTGAYFDTLYLDGSIYDAQKGMGDSIQVMLYPAEMPDSMLLKQKPLYVTKASGGNFSFRGLPSKQFKIAALSDKNANYLYDVFDEKIAFYNANIDVRNKDSAIILYSFIEDKMRDTAQAKKGLSKKGPKGKLSYSLNPDIKSKKKMDMQDTLRIQLIDTAATVNLDKIRFYENDVLDLSVAPVYNDSLGIITLYPDWKMGTDYMLILQKAFLKDTSASGTEVDTIRFSTMRDEDYSTMVVKVDSALYQADGVLLLIADDVEIRRSNNINKAVRFEKLKPGAYTLRLLYDRNNNGQWDAGELKSRIQPERTIELPQTINLKPNWEEKVEWILGKGKARMGKK